MLEEKLTDRSTDESNDMILITIQKPTKEDT